MTNRAKVGDIIEILKEPRYLLPKPRGLVHHINVDQKTGDRLLEIRVPSKFWKSTILLRNRDKGNIVLVNDKEIKIL
jgi:hypothetical protein